VAEPVLVIVLVLGLVIAPETVLVGLSVLERNCHHPHRRST
jgi:hypothetical protein